VATMWARPAAVDTATLVPVAFVVSGTVLFLALILTWTGSRERSNRADYGIIKCPEGAHADLLSSTALQCWFGAAGGRWRTLAHVSAHGALVVEVGAAVVNDADEIARRFVADRGGRFSEVLVYVQREGAIAPMQIRRIRWTETSGFERVDFTTSPAP
jgi:hypothetical protein